MAFRPVNRTDDPKWRTSGGEPAFGEMLADFINPLKGNIVDPHEGHTFPTNGYAIASGEDFEKGDLVRLDGTPELGELSAITQTVLGVATEPIVNGAAGGPVTDKCGVTRASRLNSDTGVTVKTRFATVDVNGTAPLASHVGDKVALDLTAGEWTLDISDTANQDVEVMFVDTVRGEFIVEFLDAVIQTP